MRGELGARVDARVRRENVDSPVLGDDAGRHRVDRRRSVTSVATANVSSPCVRSAVAVDSASSPSRSPMHDTGPLGGEHGGDPATDPCAPPVTIAT